MKVEVKKLKNAKVEIDLAMEWPEFEVYYQKALDKINQGISLDGFRPGKAPKDIIEQKVDSHKILEQAAENALQDSYRSIVKENNLEVIGPPRVEILKLAKGNEFLAKIKADILPEIDLPDYQKIVSKIALEKAEVGSEEIEETIKWIQKSRANMQETETDLPEITDDFVKTLGNFANVEELKKNIKEGLTAEKNHYLQEQWKDNVLKAISDEINIEMPEQLISMEKERIMHNSKQGEISEKEASETACQRVKNYLILKAIGEKEAVKVLDEDLEKEINRLLTSYPQVNPQEIDKEGLKGVLYNNKVFDILEKFCGK